MKRLFGHKPKSAKPSKDFAEDVPRQQQFATPVYQKLATRPHSPSISQPSLQQSTQQIPSPSDDEWNQQQPIAATQPISNLQTTPPAIHTPTRSNSLTSMPHVPLTTLPPPPRSASPMSTMSTGGTRSIQQDRKVASSALGILGSLDPPRSGGALVQHRSVGRVSEDQGRPESYTVSESGHPNSDKEKEKKKGFWSSSKEKEREKEREREKDWQRESHARNEEYERVQRERGRDGVIRRDDDTQAELTRMIGYLTATASEDWLLVMEVCQRASATDSSAKEAVRALRREFKYGEPAAQLSAARLWAIMLRNSSEIFIAQSTSRKFLDTLEEILSSSRTSPVVRERLLEVVAAAAFASGSKKGSDKDGFKGLWKRVKPFDKPDEGVPFDTDDTMFQPPQPGAQSGHEVPTFNYQEPSPLPTESNPATPTPRKVKDRKSPTRGDRIISRDEDMRRLFQECKIGEGNAGVLADALVGARPEDLKTTDVIREFHGKCCASQELIYAQIPWATSIAEHSRLGKPPSSPKHDRKRTLSNDRLLKERAGLPPELTIEEQLLNALLHANAELMGVLAQWDDLNRIALEKKVENWSKKEAKLESKEYESSISTVDSSVRDHSPRSRSHSPMPIPPLPKSNPPIPPPPPSTYTEPKLNHGRAPSIQEHDSDPSIHSQNLAPPPSAPHGPRLPGLRSRTPSPTKHGSQHPNGRGEVPPDSDSGHSDDDEVEVFVQPSAKALGKRRIIEPEVPERHFDPDDIYANVNFGQSTRDSTISMNDSRWRPPPTRFVYDAVAERTRHLLGQSQQPDDQKQREINGFTH